MAGMSMVPSATGPGVADALKRKVPGTVTAAQAPSPSPTTPPAGLTQYKPGPVTQPTHQSQAGDYGYGNVGQQLGTALNATSSQATQGQNNATQSRNGFLDMLSQDPSQILGSYVSSAMPEFNKALQGIRENSIQRGISTGDLGTSYEGDLASAFQRNIAGEAANLYGQRMSGYENLAGLDQNANQNNQNRYLDLLTGQRDYEEQKREADQANKSSLFGSIGNVLGTLGGAAITKLL